MLHRPFLIPGSAKGLEEEGANANVIIRPSVFASNRRPILGASILSCRGRVQNTNNVIHLIVEQVIDLTADLKRVSGLDLEFPVPAARGETPASDQRKPLDE